MSETTQDRPEIVTDYMLKYLDELRDSGVTNMFGAGPYIQDEFDLSQEESWQVLSFWMKTFGERHASESRQ